MGRRVAAALFWVAAAWICISGFVSVIPQVFWPAEAARVEPATPEEGCGPALHTLYDDLLDLSARHVRPEAGDPSDALAAWDHRFLALSAACGSHRGYHPLARLRHGTEDELGRLASTQTLLAADTLVAIESQH